jgi:hypothetical protein
MTATAGPGGNVVATLTRTVDSSMARPAAEVCPRGVGAAIDAFSIDRSRGIIRRKRRSRQGAR